MMRRSFSDAASTKKLRDAALVYVDRRLERWATWARENHDSLGYPTVSSLFRAMMEARRETKKGVVRRKTMEDVLVIFLTAQGKDTRSMRLQGNGYIPEEISEIDLIVAILPKPLESVLVANYFTYGPIEVRAKAAALGRARFFQLLESAKYSVYAHLESRRKVSDSPYSGD